MTLNTLIAIIVICLAIIVVLVNVFFVVRYLIKLYLEEVQRRRDAEDARDKRRATELAGIISDLRDANEAGLRVVGEVIKGVVESNNGQTGGLSPEIAQQMLVEAMQGSNDVNELPMFDDFAGAVPYERELVGELPPGGMIPGIGQMGGGPTNDINTAGEKF